MNYQVPTAAGRDRTGTRPYAARIIDRTLRTGLENFARMLITGPRAVGKTRTSLEYAASQLRLDDPDDRDLCEADPMAAIGGEPPLLIGEWQMVPEVLRAVKRRRLTTLNPLRRHRGFVPVPVIRYRAAWRDAIPGPS